MAVACITGEVFRLIEKHHTWRLAVVTFFVNLICLISAAIVLFDGTILNPEYLQSIGTSVNNEFALTMLTNIPLIVFGAMALAAVLSCVVACVKASKYDRGTLGEAITDNQTEEG
jgi:Mn2+/Fe2+ NRAMP family transporter